MISAIRLLFVTSALLVLASTLAQAQEATAVPSMQARAFLLGYTLRACDLRFLAFTQSVKALKSLDDSDAKSDLVAGAEVSRLSSQAGKLRQSQAIAYWQIAKTLTKMGAPKTLHDWATQTADMLDADLIYSDEAKALAKTEPDTAKVLAELDEGKAIKDSAAARFPTLAAWIKLNGGVPIVWTADLGSYAADLHTATPPLVGATRKLLINAPKGTPSEVRGLLSELIPRGGGNLQDLATIPPSSISPAKMRRIHDQLLGIYGARN